MAETNEKVNQPGQTETTEEKEQETIQRSDTITEDDLVKQFGNKQVNKVLSELFTANKIVSVFIDQRSGGVFFNGETKIRGDVIGRDQEKSDKGKSQKVLSNQTISSVLKDVLEKIKSVFVSPNGYEAVFRSLQENRIIILHGQSHFGKYTSALYMLFALHHYDIFELNPAADLSALNFKDNESVGYVIDNFSANTDHGFSKFRLNQLAEQLRSQNAHLVITINEEFTLSQAGLENYLFTSTNLPDQHETLVKHIDFYSENTDSNKRIVELCDRDEVKDLLNQNLLPGEIDQLVYLLFEVSTAKMTYSEALMRFKSRIDHQVKNWFETHSTLEDRFLILTVAVLNGASFQSIISVEQKLFSLLPNADSKTVYSQDVFGATRTQRIQSIGAEIKTGVEETEFGRNSLEIIEFSNPAIQSSILKFVWKEFSGLREILITWIFNSGVEGPYDVRVRVAAAAGELSKYDFGFIRKNIFLPWGNHPDPMVRAATAYALGVPAWDSDIAPQVIGLLHHWSSLDNWRLCWTAAFSYGNLVGFRFPDFALRDLHHICKSGDLRLLKIVTQSMSNLFSMGEMVPTFRQKVLGALISWTENTNNYDGIAGLFIFLFIAKNIRTKADPEGDSWPTLLWLVRENTYRAKEVVLLWRRALNTKQTRSLAAKTLNSWLHVVDKDTRLSKQLCWIFQEIQRIGSERELRRLLFYLRNWQNQSSISSIAEDILSSLHSEE